MKKTSRLGLLPLVLIFLVQGCKAANVTRATLTPTKGSGNVVISTFTVSPAAVPTQTISSTASPDVQGKIPGLSPVNVTLRLEEQKFTCTIVRKQGSSYQRTCTRGVPSVQVFQVIVFGSEPFLLDAIEASILQYEDPDIETASSILGLIASLPYDGAAPEEALSWLESAIQALSAGPAVPQELESGGVKFVLQGSATALTLKMGELP